MIIDVSHHNGKINWVTAARYVTQVYLKATEGRTFKDRLLIKNAHAINDLDIPLGYYHFATLNSHDSKSDALSEAKFFISVLDKVPQPDLPLVLDIETNKIGVHKKNVELFAHTFFEYVQSQGYYEVMLYSNTHFLNDNLPDNHTLGKYPLWLADYNDPYIIPKGWKEIRLHQYTDSGSVKGIGSKVDLNRYTE